MSDTTERCGACLALASPFKLAQYQRFPHLRHFLSHYQDDLLSTDFHQCPQCGQLWQEDDCDYPADAGYFWKEIAWELFLKQNGEHLPPTAGTTPETVQAWIDSFEGFYSVELFRIVYRDENGRLT